MKYHAIITIVDDNNHEITRAVYEEMRQFEMPKNNINIHEFYIGTLAVPEGRDMCQFIEEMKGGAEND